MAYYIRQLKDMEGNSIFPATRASAVFFDDNTKVQDVISGTPGVVKKAQADKNGKDVTEYIAGASIEDHKITLTKGDGTPIEITVPDKDTTYEEATQSQAGLMSAADKTKLDGIAPNANNYAHPSYDAQPSGLYKVTIDNTGHVSATDLVTKTDITALGIPAQDTTYSEATQSQAGLMSAADKKKLDGISAGSLGVVSGWGKTAEDLPELPEE